MKFNKEVAGKLVTFLAFILFFTFLTVQGEKNEKKFVSAILKNPEISKAQVDDVKYFNKHGYTVYFHFEKNYCIVYGTSGYSDLGTLIGVIKNKTFPVIFNYKEVNLNTILITPKDFQRFNLTFPDSLQWVTEYQSH